MSSVLTVNSTQSPSRSRAFTIAGALVLLLWASAAAFSAPHLSALEAANAGALSLALFAALIGAGLKRLSASAAGRLWTLGLFVFSAVLFSPAFQHTGTGRALQSLPLALKVSLAAPLAASLLIWMLWRGTGAGRAPSATPSIAEALEELLQRVSVRLNLAALGALVIGAGLGFSGQPLRAVLPRSIILGALIFASPAVLRLAGSRLGTGLLQAVLLITLGLGAAHGAWRFSQAQALMSQARAALEQDKPDVANPLYAQAAAFNEVLNARTFRVNSDTDWALYFERKEQFEQSLVHWRRIAEMTGKSTEEMLPIRRVLIKAGDSLTAWRQMIYKGFSAIRDPEIAPGIRALGDKPSADLRARLMAAFLAWEENAPEAERRRRLENVRQLLINEPSANALLKRMGVKLPEGPLWLPAELIVGTRLSKQSLLGSIDELGAVDTVVVLDEGDWELALNARATPLHEIWPIVRLEFNGQPLATTQVTHATDHDVPFTFKVNRGDLYHVKIVMLNCEEVLDQGSYKQRGLKINGLTFRRSEKGTGTTTDKPAAEKSSSMQPPPANRP